MVSVKNVEVAKQIQKKIISAKYKPDIDKRKRIEAEIDIPTDTGQKPSISELKEKLSTSILKPSAAINREEQRQHAENNDQNIKKSQRKKTEKIVKIKKITPKKVIHQKVKEQPSEVVKSRPIAKQKPSSKLTEWEKKWHKYDSGLNKDELNGYS